MPDMPDMPEPGHDPPDRPTGDPAGDAGRARRGPDPLLLFAGLVCLAVAVLTLIGWLPGWPLWDPRWLLAGGASAAGLLLLASSVRAPGDKVR